MMQVNRDKDRNTKRGADTKWGADTKRGVAVEGPEGVAAHDLLQICAGEPSGLPRKLARKFGMVVHLQDVVTVLESDRKLGGFRKCSQRARELLAECVINLLILEGAFTPLGLDTYRVNEG